MPPETASHLAFFSLAEIIVFKKSSFCESVVQFSSFTEDLWVCLGSEEISI